jgi:methyl-CpG-binding domain protein 4
MSYLTDQGLIQEIYCHHPWRMLVGCIMLNKTSHKQVRSVIKEFFEKYPYSEYAAVADEAEMAEMAEILKPLGFHNRRASTIKKFSAAYFYFKTYLCDKYSKVSDLPGIGKYASDSYEIFVNRNFNVQPTDKELIKYLDGKKNTDIR